MKKLFIIIAGCLLMTVTGCEKKDNLALTTQESAVDAESASSNIYDTEGEENSRTIEDVTDDELTKLKEGALNYLNDQIAKRKNGEDSIILSAEELGFEEVLYAEPVYYAAVLTQVGSENGVTLFYNLTAEDSVTGNTQFLNTKIETSSYPGDMFTLDFDNLLYDDFQGSVRQNPYPVHEGQYFETLEHYQNNGIHYLEVEEVVRSTTLKADEEIEVPLTAADVTSNNSTVELNILLPANIATQYVMYTDAESDDIYVIDNFYNIALHEAYPYIKKDEGTLVPDGYSFMMENRDVIGYNLYDPEKTNNGECSGGSGEISGVSYDYDLLEKEDKNQLVCHFTLPDGNRLVYEVISSQILDPTNAIEAGFARVTIL